MKFAGKTAVMLLLVLSAWLAWPAGADARAAGNEAAHDTPVELSGFHWDGPMVRPRPIFVRNRYGDVRIRSSDLPRLFVSAQIQRFDPRQAPPTLAVIEREDDSLEVRIDHEHAERVGVDGDPRAGFAGRIDVTLLVPDGASVVAETTDGTLRVKGFDGSIDARTGSGDLSYRARGSARLRTAGGSVEAIVTEYETDLPMMIASQDGPIRVHMTPDASARLVVRTDAATELAVLEGKPAAMRCEAGTCEMTLGEGRRAIRIDSAWGPVSITVDRNF